MKIAQDLTCYNYIKIIKKVFLKYFKTTQL